MKKPKRIILAEGYLVSGLGAYATVSGPWQPGTYWDFHDAGYGRLVFEPMRMRK